MYSDAAAFVKTSPIRKMSIPMATAVRSVVLRWPVPLWRTMGRETKIESPIIDERTRVSAKFNEIPALRRAFNAYGVNGLC